MIGLIDYGCGNLRAFQNIFKAANISSMVVTNSNQIEACDKFILPGVGSFDWVIRNFRSSPFFDKLEVAVLDEKKPILGVCVGMQIMATNSDEGVEQGLNWICGTVKHLDSLSGNHLRLPHMGWNKCKATSGNQLIEKSNADSFYFLHSYYFVPSDSDHNVAKTTYGSEFCVFVKRDNIMGVQFHPEKSHSQGTDVLLKFASY